MMMVMIACLGNVIVIAAAGLPVRQVLKGRLGRKALRERRVPLASGERLALPVPAGCQAPRECLGRKACLVPVAPQDFRESRDPWGQGGQPGQQEYRGQQAQQEAWE